VELQKTGDVAAAAEKLRDLDRDRITQALSRLTDEQQRKFQQMCGQPFNTAPLWSATEKQD
jgi:Mg/Co/Ni transporter MgtE